MAYSVDLQNCREFGKAVQKNDQKLPSQHSDHSSRKYSLPNQGQSGPGRNDERRPLQNNLFEQDEDEEVPYHQKLKFQ